MLETEVTQIVRELENSGQNLENVKTSLFANYTMLYWACQYGIVDKEVIAPLPGKMQDEMRKKLPDGKPDPEDTHIYTGVDLMIGGSVREIGTAIIEISSSESKELADFFKALKPKEVT